MKKSLCDLLTSFADFPWSRSRFGQRNSVGKIPIPACTAHCPSSCSALSVPNKSQHSPEVNDQFGRIELRGDAEFRCSIVKWVLVMPVVPSFSDSAERDKGVLRRIRQNIVWVVSVQVGGRVDKPSEMQNNGIAKGTSYKETIPELLAPKVGSNLRRENVAHVQGKPWV